MGQPAQAAPSPWFSSARFDLLLILGVPFLTWPLIMAAKGAWGPDLLNRLILLTASGHYFATFVRAYGDRELFARFRARFLVIPGVLFATCLVLLENGRGGALLLATAVWAFWHWLAQAFGFARIYDIKVGSFRPLTARLDKALVLTGFVGAATLNDGAVATFGKVFLDAGVPLPSAATLAVLQRIVLGAIVVVGAAYVANLAWTIARGLPWSWQKQFMHVTTIGYYWFAFAWLPNVLVAYVLYELFHDIQYYAITWLTCRSRVRRPGVAPWLTRMFRPGWGAALGFVALMSLFGAIDLGGRFYASDPAVRQVSLAVFITAALLHYYYDGFIWKARESALGGDLGIQGGLRATLVPGLRHGAYWALFFVPLAALVAFGRGEGLDPREHASALVRVAPGDFLSQAQLAHELTRSGDAHAAVLHYRASIAANPEFSTARANLGNVLEQLGDVAGAAEQYAAALRCPDHGGAHRMAYVNLGVLELMRGAGEAARAHFDAGRRLGGEDPVSRMLALAAALPAQAVDQRRRLYPAILELDPNQVDAHFNLGNGLLAEGQLERAASHYAAVAAQAPRFVPGLLGLAAAQAQLGQLDAARRTLGQALQVEPQNSRALAMLAQLDAQ